MHRNRVYCQSTKHRHKIILHSIKKLIHTFTFVNGKKNSCRRLKFICCQDNNIGVSDFYLCTLITSSLYQVLNVQEKRYMQGVGMNVTVKCTDTDIIKNENRLFLQIASNKLLQSTKKNTYFQHDFSHLDFFCQKIGKLSSYNQVCMFLLIIVPEKIIIL